MPSAASNPNTEPVPKAESGPSTEAAQRAIERIAAARERAFAIGAASASADSHGIGGTSTLRVRCPHCQQQVEVAEETSWSQIVCGDCGSTFSLIGDGSSSAIAGTHLGRFELLSPIGEGGFGAVWRALDTRLQRTVAVKFPRRGELSPVEAELFLREARATAQLRHPHIVSLHEVGREGTTLYLVYDFIAGQSLAERLRQRMSVDEAVQICETVARALDYAHGMGIVHRDLKPANILLDQDEVPRLADFGLAKRDAGEITMTMDGQLVGTPAYMSPEQARGRSHDADARSDIYSLGVVLFEMLTGELPFRGSPPRVIEQVLSDDAPSPRTLNAKIPRDLETICLKCLEKNPAARYASAAELAADLTRFRRRQPVMARPAGPLQKLLRAYRKHPVAANSLLLVGVLAVCGPLAAVHEARLVQREKQSRLRGDRYLYVAQMNNIQDACETGDYRGAVELLNQHRPVAGGEDLRGFEWRYWWGVCHRGLVGQIVTGQRLQALAVSPDGSTIAYGGADARLTLCDRATLREIRALEGHTQPLSAVLYSPDGRWIVTSSHDHSVRLWNSANGVCVATAEDLPAAVRGIALSRDGSKLAAALEDGTARIWDVAIDGATVSDVSAKDISSRDTVPQLVPASTHVLDGRPSTPSDESGTAYCVAWNYAGTHLALGVGGSANWSHGEMQWWNVATGQCETRVPTDRPCDYLASAADHDLTGQDLIAVRRKPNTISLWNPASQSEQQSLVCPAGEVFSPVFTPDGRDVIASSDRGVIWRWDIASGEIVESWPGHAGYVYAIAALPQGNGLVSAGMDGNVRLWRSVPPASEAPTPSHAKWVGGVEIDRGSSIVVSKGGEGTGHVWNLADGQLLNTVVGTPNAPAMALSPDGKYLAYRAAENAAALWDVRANKSVATFQPQRDSIYCMTYSPDGRFLAVAGGNAKSSWPGDPTDLRLWQTDTERVLHELTGNRRLVRCMAFSPDGRTLATGGFDRVVLLWDVATGAQRGVLDPKQVYNVVCLTFSPDGKTLAFATHDGSLWLADPQQPATPLRRFTSQDGYIWAIAYSPDGKTLAAAYGHEQPGSDESGTIKFWDAATSEIKSHLATGRRLPSALAFASDGQTLATGFRDGSLHLYRGPEAEFLSRSAEMLRSAEKPLNAGTR